MNKKIIAYSFLFLGLVLAGSSCKSLKGSKLYNAYHNTTARFNGYFNAKEKMIAIEDKLFDEHVDNFNKILDVFAITNDKNVKTYTADNDLVQKKCSKVIQKHGSSKWIKNCYYLIAKANFYKRDYYTAIETFEYVSEKYPDADVGKDSRVWLIRCYMENSKMNDAQNLISAANADKNSPVESKPFLNIVEADYAIRTNDYKTAIARLEYALPLLKVKKYRTRYMFILAQLYQLENMPEKAAKYYKMVIKRNPPYEFSFQSRLKLAEVSTNNNEIEAYLMKLLKDDRNLTYFDQVYYTLAKVELKQGNSEQAIKFLKLSTRYSKGNDNQKAMSYMLEADLYFKRPVYPFAKMFYDSAGKFLTKEYPDYDAFKARQSVLSDLITSLITVQLQDSLLKISKLDTVAINKLIDDIIEKNKQAAIQKQSKNATEDISPSLNIPTLSGGSSTGKESYFYNALALSQGYTDFQAKWANRPRADDWRRKNKPIVNNTDNPGSHPDSAAKKDEQTEMPEAKVVAANRQKYYLPIPFSPSQKSIANNKIQEALFNIGTIYANSIGDYKKAEEAFEELLERYPTGNYVVQAHYNLYTTYKADSNKEKSEYHKSIILRDFPSSIYAQLIMNPDQLRDKYVKSKKNDDLEKLYGKAFAHFQANNCLALDSDFTESNSRFAKNYLKPKFEYLMVVCKGKKDSVSKFVDDLKAFMKKYPGEDVTREVQKQIDYLQTGLKIKKIEQMSQDTATIKNQILGKQLNVKVEYQKTQNQPHHYIIVFPAKANKGVVETSLTNFNNESYASQGLKLVFVQLDDKRNIYEVDNFEDEKQAMKYFNELAKTKGFYSDMALEYHKEFIISETNLKLFMDHNDVDGYAKFFKEDYLP